MRNKLKLLVSLGMLLMLLAACGGKQGKSHNQFGFPKARKNPCLCGPYRCGIRRQGGTVVCSAL